MISIRTIEYCYAAPANHAARAYWIPMFMHDEVRAAYKAAGIPIRTKFRGPRTNQIGIPMSNGRGGSYARHRTQAFQTCLKDYATHFSVYNK